ncbi:MAG: tetratricopeptide repeat protein [Proteobacteria bacterium]|nr:tetratricopeptide repeat protein [Pseudomonadota bacterium]
MAAGSTAEPRRVGPDEAIAIGLTLHKEGHLEAAEAIYRKVLDAVPGHVDAMHYLALVALESGDPPAAERIIGYVLEAAPAHADAHANLGLVYNALGRLPEAEAAFRRAIELDPKQANAYSNLGIVLRALGRPEEAEATYRRAIEVNPQHAEAHHNLGTLLSAGGRIKEAVHHYCVATTLDPAHRQVWRSLAYAYATIGDRDNAVRVVREWLERHPGDPVAEHTLAATSGEGVPARAADAYVERIFDDFAATFDLRLASLGYRAPQLCAALLGELRAADGGAEVLDAGCGTGLCAPLLAPYARRLTGVDLSANMLDKARQRGGYDELVRAELGAYLAAQPGRFDVIVSADTLCYFGDLGPVLAAAAGALAPGGVLVFTVEGAPPEVEGYRLDPHGRYCHARPYLEAALAAAGLVARIEPAQLRMEGGEPVAGLVVAARRAGAARA